MTRNEVYCLLRSDCCKQLRQSLILIIGCVLLSSCRAPKSEPQPVIEFSQVPPADLGGPDKRETLAGRVTGARTGQRIVLFAKSGQWWVQPTARQPFTEIRPDSSWSSSIHLGVEYAALLVGPQYAPPTTMDALPEPGGAVIAIATVKGEGFKTVPPRTLHFSGYDWNIRHLPSPRGGATNNYAPENAWTDGQGCLHLRIAKKAGQWSCAEVNLQRSLGYGSYRFVVREIAHLEPAAVLGIYTWDDLNAEQNHRELDLEITRWGDPASKNTQYTIQPYYVPVNIFRFATPGGVTTHSFQWEPGRVSFQSVRGKSSGEFDLSARSLRIAEHAFTSGVPSPGSESVHISFYVYGLARTPLQNETEVVIEKFEYLP